MKWRTDKPTADVIVVHHPDTKMYDILRRIDGKYYLYTMFGAKEIPIDEIKKWADLEEDEGTICPQKDEPVTDCHRLEEEFDAFIKSGKAIKEENCGSYTTTYIDTLKVARHFAKWQKEQDHYACRQCEKDYDNVFYKGEQHAIKMVNQLSKAMENIREENWRQIAHNAASSWCRCFKCDGIVNETGAKCEKPDCTCLKWRDAYKGSLIALESLNRKK